MQETQETRVQSLAGENGKSSWSRKWQPIPLFLPGKSHGQRNLADYSPWCGRVGQEEGGRQSFPSSAPPTAGFVISPPGPYQRRGYWRVSGIHRPVSLRCDMRAPPPNPPPHTPFTAEKRVLAWRLRTLEFGWFVFNSRCLSCVAAQPMAKAVSYSHDVPTTSPLPPVSVSTHTHTHTHTHFSLEFQCAQPQGMAYDRSKPRVGKPWPEAKSDCPFFFVCPTNSDGFFFFFKHFQNG